MNGFLQLKFPDGTIVPWGADYSFTSKLLVLKEYERIFREITSIPNLLKAYLSGTKGIGKTIFLFWLIYKLVDHAHKSQLRIPSILLIVGNNQTKYLLRINKPNEPEVKIESEK